jgi:type IV fimbrial biogenesis protein FimT
MMSAIHFTRSEAVKQRALVSICAKQQGECQSNHWQHHLIIYKDLDGNGLREENEPILRVFTLPDDYAWHWSNFRRRPYLTYQANGSTHALNGTLTLCKQDTPVHAIVINRSGRTRHSAPKDLASCAP